MTTPRLAVFVSGTGSLLEAMIKDRLSIHLVLADRPCRAVSEVAIWDTSIKRAMIAREPYKDGNGKLDRELYTHQVFQTLSLHGIELVAMAGFMTVLAPNIFAASKYGDRILNTHPSLLPRFKGDHAVRDALAAGVNFTGCTIHVATEELDAGPILAQERVPVLPGDTAESLHERIKEVERVLYPKTIRIYSASTRFANAA